MPYFTGTGTAGQPGYVPGLLPKGQEVFARDYATTYAPLIGAGLSGAGGIASLSPMQQQVGTEIGQMGTPSQFQMGMGAAGSAYGILGGNMPSITNQGLMQQYMSPYSQNVVDVQKQEAIRDAQKGMMAQNLGAARQGTYGGARQLLGQTEREKGLMQTLGDIQMRGSQAAFENAQQQFERDQARRMGAQQLNVQTGLQADLANQQQMMEAQRAAEQSRQFGASTALQGFQTALQGAGQLAQIGRDTQTSELARLQAQQTVANAEQQMEQRRLDQAYQDFLAQREFPYRQLEFYNAMLRGLPVQANTTSTQYGAQPNMAQQILGYGIPALALSKAFSAT
jgi:hypothetical protein